MIPFHYPEHVHVRRHGPRGYRDIPAFVLGCGTSLHIDHFLPISQHPTQMVDGRLATTDLEVMRFIEQMRLNGSEMIHFRRLWLEGSPTNYQICARYNRQKAIFAPRALSNRTYYNANEVNFPLYFESM